MNQHQFAAILNALNDPAIILDRDYRIVAANRAYTELYGIETQSQTCYSVSHGYSVPCDQAGEHCPLKSSLNSGERERVLHIHNTPQGKEHIDVELTPITNEANGQIEYFVEIMKTLPNRSNSKMIGYSPAFTDMLSLLNRAAPSDINVLLLGESGTGKELAAQHLHSNSNRRSKPFVTVECSGLSENLFESELFGHEKGAFTGAITKKPGLVEAANGGTLFLDEVGDIPLAMQVKLLRLIETGRYRSVGSVTEKQADFRLICATHQSLHAMVENGRFRQDLYYRISPFPVKLPALRTRPDDIALLSSMLLTSIDKSKNYTLSQAALNWLMGYNFPGNIRELRNLLERATLLCDGSTIDIRHLESKESEQTSKSIPFNSDNILSLEDMEQAYLHKVNRFFSGDNRQLAKILGISERTLYRKLQTSKTDPL
jgi:transcriptional regulator with PAS, ATPase and Fis domain